MGAIGREVAEGVAGGQMSPAGMNQALNYMTSKGVNKLEVW